MPLFPEAISLRSPRFLAVAALLILLAMVPPIANYTGGPFYVTLSLRILIFALAATSLNLLLGYGGLGRFGRALYLGVAAYVVAVVSLRGMTNRWGRLLVTLALSVALAVLPSPL